VAINWFGASLCFWTTRSNAAMYITERFTVLMQQYPVNIFGRYFQIFVTCFLPVAFINYYPSVVLLGKAAEVQLWQYGAPVVAFLLLAITAFIWSKGVKRYAGTGN
jgi:ABC-2 type transport system permease protein